VSDSIIRTDLSPYEKKVLNFLPVNGNPLYLSEIVVGLQLPPKYVLEQLRALREMGFVTAHKNPKRPNTPEDCLSWSIYKQKKVRRKAPKN
jgi:hypothetical protein